MSYFTQDGNQTNQQEQTTQEQPQNQTDFVAEVVKSKGDTWADPQVLAKGKLEADTHIANLEGQLKELRGELDKQDYAKELMEKLQNKGTPSTGENPVVNTGGTEQENTTPQFSEDELKNLIMSTLEGRDKETVRTNNLQTVDAKLTELYGNKVDEVMSQRSTELGMSKERLQDLAAESPAAFMRLVGGEANKESNPLPGKGTINTSADTFTTTGDRDWAYYQNLRRTNRSEYFSPRIQKQMMADKMRLGSKFGNT